MQSPYRKLLKEAVKDLLEPPADVPTSPSGSTQPADGVYCPLLHEEEDRAFCGYVDCGRCPLIEDLIEEVHALWLCSRCSETMASLGYWADGRCQECGFESPCLLLAI